MNDSTPIVRGVLDEHGEFVPLHDDGRRVAWSLNRAECAFFAALGAELLVVGDTERLDV